MTGVLSWDKPGPGGEAFVFRKLLAEQGANITFGAAMGRALEAMGIPLAYGTAFGILMLNAFILTTLDTCARLTRFIVTESLGQRIFHAVASRQDLTFL